MAHTVLEMLLERLRAATRGSEYEGKLYLVGGLLRDQALSLPFDNDLDLVLEGDAVALAKFLFHAGLSPHYPVTYPRFGTAMISMQIDGQSYPVELVSARAESYVPDSRKPDVRQGTLQDDVFRRDFTINTLLRMLRAVRFAARFGFEIEAQTWDALSAEAERLQTSAISSERIRDEFVKIARLPGMKFRRGMELLLQSNLLAQFLPEMLPTVGCTQGSWHQHDVWEHTLLALTFLPDHAPLETRLALLWHDIGKPPTRSISEDGSAIRFYGHPKVGAEMVRDIMNRLKFSNDEIKAVTTLVDKHMRLGDYKPDWTDAAVKRLIRDANPYLDELFVLAQCDRDAVGNIPAEEAADYTGLRVRIDALNAITDVARIASPLDGNAIQEVLNVPPGPILREAKEFLVNEVIDGRIGEGDQEAAREALRGWKPAGDQTI
jgi:poly(A) polymerase